MNRICFALSLLLIFFNAIPASASEAADASPECCNDYCSQPAPEQGYCRNLFVEFGGPSFIVGLGFDSRFKPGSVFGYRVGLSFLNGTYTDTHTSLDFKGVTVPLEVNAILGKRKSKFEIGIGAIPSILDRHQWNTSYMWVPVDGGWGYHPVDKIVEEEGTHVNIMGLMNIGYRYQRQSGFFMRVGLTLMLGDLSCSPFDGVMVLPNIAFGYTLP